MNDFELEVETDTVRRLRSAAVVQLELNRPDFLNAWNEQLALDFRAELERARDDETVRAVLITGAGRAFSVGADLKGGIEVGPDGAPDAAQVLHDLYHPIVLTVQEMQKPVIAAVSGAVAGIGASLALACDLIVASESAYFLMAFVHIGLIPDGGATALLPARIGLTRAAELMFLGERLPASKALEWGLINRVFTDSSLLEDARALAERLSQGPTRAYADMKSALQKWTLENFSSQLAYEASLQGTLARSEDFKAGVAGFKQRQLPTFTGK